MRSAISIWHLGHSLIVMSLKSLAGSILFLMGMDEVLIDFLVRAAIGAGTVLVVLGFLGLGIPRSSSLPHRRIR